MGHCTSIQHGNKIIYLMSLRRTLLQRLGRLGRNQCFPRLRYNPLPLFVRKPLICSSWVFCILYMEVVRVRNLREEIDVSRFSIIRFLWINQSQSLNNSKNKMTISLWNSIDSIWDFGHPVDFKCYRPGLNWIEVVSHYTLEKLQICFLLYYGGHRGRSYNANS